MEENKKGSNTLYAVIGIATLIVAIIGATFAYFSATATNNDVIQGNISEAGGITVDVTPVTKTGDNLIPLNLIVGDGENDTVDQFDKAMAKACVDDLNNNICQVYKVSVKNESTSSAVQVLGSLKLTSNAANMHWKLIDATVTETEEPIEGSEETNKVLTMTAGTSLDYAVNHKQDADNAYYLTVGGNANPVITDEAQAKEQKNLKLDGGASKEYYVLVWLEEMGAAQEDDDASNSTTQRTFKGEVTFDAVDDLGNKSGVTATFTS